MTQAVASAGGTKSKTVLIVQTEALVRMEMAWRLKDMQLVVLGASEADEAVDLLEAHPETGLMVTDIRMPGCTDGISLSHQVRFRWPAVRIIVTSGLIGTELCDLPVGSIFLSKPYGPEALKSAVSYMIGRAAPPIADYASLNV
jgi:DNA-binding NarL/FixJ family response regulator